MSGYSRSMGEYLCRGAHEDALPVENIDAMPIEDIKQETAAKTLRALARYGETVTPATDAVLLLDAHSDLASKVYSDERADWRRSRYRNAQKKRFVISLDAVWTAPSGTTYDLSDDPSLGEYFIDERMINCFDLIDSDGYDTLRHYWNHGIDGLTLKQTRQVIHLLCDVMLIRESGRPIPDALRRRLSRLRASTSLPLDITLLD